MKKIENIIENCNDCQFCKEVVETNGNTFYACLCIKKELENFVIATSCSKIKDYTKLPIPPICPLENYTNDNV